MTIGAGTIEAAIIEAAVVMTAGRLAPEMMTGPETETIRTITARATVVRVMETATGI